MMSTGQRFKQWVYNTFGDIKSASRAFKMSSSSFYDYFNDKTKPGSGIIEKCIKFGIDLNWLYGNTNKEYLAYEEPEIYNAKDAVKILAELKSELDKICLDEFKTDLSKKSMINIFETRFELLNIVKTIIKIVNTLPTVSAYNKFVAVQEIYVMTELNPYTFKRKLEELIQSHINHLEKQE